MNLPNKLTLGRIFAIPVFIVVLLMGHNVAACIIFIAAAFTDMLDGKIARKYNLVTNFGKLMDPLADKLLTMSAFLCLVELGSMPAWMASLAVNSSSQECARWLRLKASLSQPDGAVRSRQCSRWWRSRC